MNRLAQPVPKLATLVVASAFDAALHDAYGKLHGLNCYKTYSDEFLHNDLSHYLGDEFSGERLHELHHRPSPSRGCRCIISSAPSTRSRQPMW